LPVVDKLASEYSDRVDFVAPAWKSTFEATKTRANELLVSGEVIWGLDEEQDIFDLYGVPYQPATILIAHDDTVVEAWPGVRSEDDIRAALDKLLALAG
jgi:hypothetical protein